MPPLELSPTQRTRLFSMSPSLCKYNQTGTHGIPCLQKNVQFDERRARTQKHGPHSHSLDPLFCTREAVYLAESIQGLSSTGAITSAPLLAFTSRGTRPCSSPRTQAASQLATHSVGPDFDVTLYLEGKAVVSQSQQSLRAFPIAVVPNRLTLQVPTLRRRLLVRKMEMGTGCRSLSKSGRAWPSPDQQCFEEIISSTLRYAIQVVCLLTGLDMLQSTTRFACELLTGYARARSCSHLLSWGFAKSW